MAVSPDGRCIVTASKDNIVAVWDLETGKLVHTLKGHQDRVNSVAVSPDGRRIISGSCDKTLAVWDLHASRRPGLLVLDGMISSVAWHPDCRLVVAVAGGNLDRLEYREP